MMRRLPTAGRRPSVGQSQTAFAWQVHTALESWTAKADVKASIMIAFEGGAAVVIVSSRDMVLDRPDRWPVVLAGAGLVLLLAAMIAAATVILPMMGSRHSHQKSFAQNWIYFGHLRLWQPAELAARLARITYAEELAALSWQLVRMSEINWRKHRLLQSSVVLTVAALCCITLAALGAFHRN